MDKIKIVRTGFAGGASATVGKIYLNDVEVGFTLEPGLAKRVPAGTYSAKVYNSPQFSRKVILLKNVPGRTYIEIHHGNAIYDTTGCILVGNSLVGAEVWHSTVTLDLILGRLKTPDNIQVTIK